jgi:hypothetical protein
MQGFLDRDMVTLRWFRYQPQAMLFIGPQNPKYITTGKTFFPIGPPLFVPKPWNQKML